MKNAYFNINSRSFICWYLMYNNLVVFFVKSLTIVLQVLSSIWVMCAATILSLTASQMRGASCVRVSRGAKVLPAMLSRVMVPVISPDRPHLSTLGQFVVRCSCVEGAHARLQRGTTLPPARDGTAGGPPWGGPNTALVRRTYRCLRGVQTRIWLARTYLCPGRGFEHDTGAGRPTGAHVRGSNTTLVGWDIIVNLKLHGYIHDTI